METLPSPSIGPGPLDTELSDPVEYSVALRTLTEPEGDPAVRQRQFLERARLGEPGLVWDVFDRLSPYQRLELATSTLAEIRDILVVFESPHRLPSGEQWQAGLAHDFLDYFGRTFRFYPEANDTLSPAASARRVVAEYLEALPDHPLVRSVARRRFLDLLDALEEIDRWWYRFGGRH